jgi:hypothetical protein
MDLESDIISETELVPSTRQSVDRWKWRGYPQNLFGNWVADRVARSKMVENCSREPREKCKIYYVDVLESGEFKSANDTNPPMIEVDESALGQLWNQLQIEVRNGRSSLETKFNPSSLQPTGLRLRVLLVDNMKHPVLQMLGTRC